MANKRMFSKDIIDSDKFYDLPFNSQLLYFHLGMNGDVKGFVEPKKVCRMVGVKIEDLKPLIHAGFVIPFESGVVVITHWNINNLTREDREAPTRFVEELAMLKSNNNEYLLLEDNSSTTPGVLPHSIEEVSIEEDSIVIADEPAKPANEINVLIDKFKSVNPSFKTLFANKTQRQALERMIKEHSFEKIDSIISKLPDIVTRPYAPRITTPLELEKGLGKLIIFMAQESQVSKRGGTVDVG